MDDVQREFVDDILRDSLTSEQKKVDVLVAPNSWSRRMLLWTKALLDRIEVVLGLLAVFGIGFLVPTALLFGGGLQICVHVYERSQNRRGLTGSELAIGLAMTLLGGVAGALAIWVASLANFALRRRHPELETQKFKPSGRKAVRLPFAIVTTMALPQLPVLCALFLCFWWAAHFLTAFAASVGAELAGKGSLNAYLICKGASFALTFAMNVYFLLALGVFSRKRRFLLGVWRYRFLVALAAAACAFLLVQLHELVNGGRPWI
jgi:hypothetical protein